MVASSSLSAGENRRNLERVGEIGVAGGAGLRAMRLHRIDVGAVEQILVGVRVVGTDFLNQVVLPHDPARGLAGRAGAVAGATATCSVAASICRGLRRQNAI